jgi:hypothetical protein
MDKLRPVILKKFKNKNIDIFQISQEEMNKYIDEFEAEIKLKYKARMIAYNKLYYEQNKDKIKDTNKGKYKEYYATHKDDVIKRVKNRQEQIKNNNLNIE